jgi:hypothetical protein
MNPKPLPPLNHLTVPVAFSDMFHLSRNVVRRKVEPVFPSKERPDS